jgi:hypothetical protein
VLGVLAAGDLLEQLLRDRVVFDWDRHARTAVCKP